MSQALEMRDAVERLKPVGRFLAWNDPETLWEVDNRVLPRGLRKYRRRMRDWCRIHLTPFALSADADPENFDPTPILGAAAREGLFSDVAPRPIGSLSWSHLIYPPLLAQNIKVEEFCAVCAGMGVLLGAHHLGLAPIYLSGSLGAIRKWLLPVVRANKLGQPTLFSFAITEPGAGSDVEDTVGAATAKIVTRARRDGDGWVINGRKCFISGGDLAEYVTVFAAIDNEPVDSWTCFVVQRGTPGYSVGRHEKKMGQRASNAVELIFEDVRVPNANMVGPLRSGWAINKSTLNFSRGPVGAIALGIARGALESTVQHVRNRRLGGKPLIQYQNVQLAVAQMMMDVTAMRGMVWHNARLRKPNGGISSMAKVFCAELGYKVCQQALAVLADDGIVHANGVEKRLRDIRLNQIYEGANQINRLAIIETFWESEFRQPPLLGEG